ncbi:hypothetical protein CBS101457_006513 [Exobasidium rhododendri]|nr:hypothetical protein CBS101457_006513 [Exobasidium rhododendri]
MNSNNNKPSSPRLPQARRAHFSQHETDPDYVGIDETLLRAATADQAYLHQQQQQQESQESLIRPALKSSSYSSRASGTPESTVRDSSARQQSLVAPPQDQEGLKASPPASQNPFVPGYSLAVPPSDPNLTDQRALLSMSVSPLQIPKRGVPNITYTDSPVKRTESPQQQQTTSSELPSSQRRAQFVLPDEKDEKEDEDEDDEETEVQNTSALRSCRDRRPTSALISALIGNESVKKEEAEEDERRPQLSPVQNPTLGSKAGFLSHKRPSMQYQEPSIFGQLQNTQTELPSMPQQPSQAHPHHRGTSEGMFSPAIAPGFDRSASGRSSSGAISGSKPHIQHYDPLLSPSMVQPYVPRTVSSSSNAKSSSLKPALVRHDQSYENMACELGLIGKERERDHQSMNRGGIRNRLAGLYDRVVSSEHHNKTHDTREEEVEMNDSTEEEAQSTVTPRRPTMTRASSLNRLSGATLMDRRESTASAAEDTPSPAFLSKRRKSMAFILGEDDEPIEPDDPRCTGQGRKSMDTRKEYDFVNRRASYSSDYADSIVRPRSRAMSLANFVAPLKGFGSNLEKAPRRESNHGSLQAHMAERQKLILKFARALMLFGAPSHRVESQLNALALVLSVDAQFIHFPGIVIASFGDIDHHTSECHFVKSKTDLALGHLSDVHKLYKGVISDTMTVAQGTQELNRLLKAAPEWSILSRVAFNAIRCGVMAPMNFGGSFVDAFLAGCFGGGLTFVQLYFAGNNPMFSNVFEITAAIIISFLARCLSTRSVFCYQATASAGLILVLPGYIILCGSLELASKNIIAGSVRMVYAIIYALFLGFGIAIGSDLYYWIDPSSRKTMWVPLNTQTEVHGSFTFANETMPHWSGEFTFSNGTKNALNTGAINCERLPDWPWYRQPLTPLLNILFVPVFSFLTCFALLHPFKSREVPVSVIIACAGYVVNLLANHYIFERSDVVSAIGSFAIGILGNVYSRLYGASAFTAMTVAILFLVPSGMAMAGGLAMTYKGSDGDLYSNGLSIGLRMVQVSIGITTGLFASALLVYMFGNKRKHAHLFAF